MDYMTVREAAEKWSITERWVQKLCEDNRVKDAVRFSRVWLIPKDAKKPMDGRVRQKSGDTNG
ncbi:helix-turn-helix domain-containing protein [Sinanaerobacter sp. ZZT-01]|uniref:helix-turn-helix domain-containing protein n=1 Tax=Sinanaerobacter sp. ZZT-01 TaxID=3111540 RepID=UPI002D79271A|nr:helix-turn-helix domain-containing protein [Sinanaerobacter sp. ZZT-01]WRR93405.1 helix-turn-helix domain-containing protein [Sinanaerobacter sp. ZZT-01]